MEGSKTKPTPHSRQVSHDLCPSQSARAADPPSILERLIEGVLERVPPGRQPAAKNILWAQLRCYEAVLDGNTLILRRIAPVSEDFPPLTGLRISDDSYAAEVMAEEAEREGLRLEVVEEPPAPQPPDPVETLRAIVRRHAHAIDPLEVEALLRNAHARGVDVAEFARAAAVRLGRLFGRGDRRADAYAILHALLDEMTTPWPEYAGEGQRGGAATLLVDLCAFPGLILSPAREVVVRIPRTDGTVVEVIRYGRRGMSPQAAAVFEWVLSTAAFAELRPSVWGTYAVAVPRADLELLYGEVNAKTLARLDASLGFVLRITGLDDRTPFGRFASEGILPVAGVKFDDGDPERVVFRLSPPLVQAVREGWLYIRRVPWGAIVRMSRMGRLEAALVRFFAVRWHGRQGVRHPIEMTVDAVHKALLGTPAPAHPRIRWRFYARLRRAVGNLNRRDDLARVGIEPPRVIVVEVRRGRIRFRRVEALPVLPGPEADSVARWLRLRVVRRPGARTPSSVLYGDYLRFCKTEGLKPVTARSFGRRLRSLRLRVRVVKLGGRAVRVWTGVELKNKPDKENGNLSQND